MPDFLDPDRALALSKRLAIIEGFPWSIREMFDAVAECLIDWCRGAIIANRVWKAEEQAEYVITEAIREVAETGERWRGVALLRAIYRQKFEPEPEWKPYSPPRDPACPVCSGTGWKIILRNGVEFAARCPCGGKPPAEVEVDTSREAQLLDAKRLDEIRQPAATSGSKWKEEVH